MEKLKKLNVIHKSNNGSHGHLKDANFSKKYFVNGIVQSSVDPTLKFYRDSMPINDRIFQLENISENSGICFFGCHHVPQGTTLSLLLYTMYTFDFDTVVTYLKTHSHADDTQLHISFI